MRSTSFAKYSILLPEMAKKQTNKQIKNKRKENKKEEFDTQVNFLNYLLRHSSNGIPCFCNQTDEEYAVNRKVKYVLYQPKTIFKSFFSGYRWRHFANVGQLSKFWKTCLSIHKKWKILHHFPMWRRSTYILYPFLTAWPTLK